MEIDKERLIKIMDNFSDKNVAVIGDLMLDKHIYGEVSRISPEAPIPILKVEKEIYNPGGAAHLANNFASLGAKIWLFGTVGDDDAQKLLFKLLEEKGINIGGIIKTKKPTIQKIRAVSKQHLIRIDYEDDSKINEEDEKKLWSLIEKKIPEIDAIILSDYNKGTLTEWLVRNIISFSKEKNKLLTADCKPQNFRFYEGVDVLKPNKREALKMSGSDDVDEAGKILSKNLNASIIITRGAEGISVFEQEKNIFHAPAKVKKVYDVSGAGDTVLAVLTLAMASGGSLRESVELAKEAAEIVVSKLGVVTPDVEELKAALVSMIKIVPKVWGEEQWIENNEKYCGKKLIVKKDYHSSYHAHKNKEETFYVLEGNLEAIKDGKYLKLSPGEILRLGKGEYHSFRAINDAIFFEFSTQHLDEDNYRLTKSSYGTSEEWKHEIQRAIQNDKSNIS